MSPNELIALVLTIATLSPVALLIVARVMITHMAHSEWKRAEAEEKAQREAMRVSVSHYQSAALRGTPLTQRLPSRLLE